VGKGKDTCGKNHLKIEAECVIFDKIWNIGSCSNRASMNHNSGIPPPPPRTERYVADWMGPNCKTIEESKHFQHQSGGAGKRDNSNKKKKKKKKILRPASK